MAYNQNIKVPEVSWMDMQQFTADGIPIPVHDQFMSENASCNAIPLVKIPA